MGEILTTRTKRHAVCWEFRPVATHDTHGAAAFAQ